jgi:pimeloyl-ACP methyl ester carboxylesterase
VRFEDAPVRYAARRDGRLIAYQVFGEAGPDLVFLLGWPSHLGLQWQHPGFARFLARLASFTRLIVFDHPASGLSDRGPTGGNFEDRLDDLVCVMDAAGSEQAALFACHLGGRVALMFAATYPHRARAVVTFGAHPTTFADDDYPWGITPEDLDHLAAQLRAGFTPEGHEFLFRQLSPHGDAATAAWWRLFIASASSPAESSESVSRLGPVDIRAALGSVRVPTLIMHRSDDVAADVRASRFMADRIPGARFVELPGSDHLPFLGDADTVLDLTEEFLTGAPPAREPDRVLATIMFTDIVDSTGQAARMGDRRWREMLASHDAAIRHALERFRGREVHTTGDGFLATFDGPARAVRCAEAIRADVGALGLEVRIGLHAGEFEILGDDVGGIAVHIAARVMANAGASEIVCSRTVKDLTAGSELSFADLGEHELKGVPDRWQLFRIEG